MSCSATEITAPPSGRRGWRAVPGEVRKRREMSVLPAHLTRRASLTGLSAQRAERIVCGVAASLRTHAGSVGSLATAAVCAARTASSRSASAGSLVARIAAASSAAFTAPERPIARVPTGTPAGI